MVEIAEYLINHSEGLKTKLKPDVNKIYENVRHFKDTYFWDVYSNECKKECVLLLVRELHENGFNHLTFDDLWVIVDEELVMKTLGKEYFEYE